MPLVERRDALIKKWLKEAAFEIENSTENELNIETKSSRSDFVTNMDRKIEEKLVEKIKNEYPTDQIVSEEGYGDEISEINMDEGTVWFLDPIDGTMNFVLQSENYAIMIAVFQRGVGLQSYIYDVDRGKLYWAIKGRGVYCNNQQLSKMKDISLKDGLFAANSKFLSDKQISLNTEILKRSMGVRTNGSAGLEAVEIAKGNTVAYITYGLNAWDIAPGLVLVEENGGLVTHFDGTPVDLFAKKPVLMGTPGAVSEIQELIKKEKK